MAYRRVGLRGALSIHDLQIVEHSGAEGLRDMALLESALARPHQLLLVYGTPDIAAMRVEYAVVVPSSTATSAWHGCSR
jgi:death-on-curing protein